jgi:hypothetical protein
MHGYFNLLLIDNCQFKNLLFTREEVRSSTLSSGSFVVYEAEKKWVGG